MARKLGGEFFLCLSICLLSFPLAAMAGQHVEIDGNTSSIPDWIFGNGNLPNGGLTGVDTDYLLEPDANSVTITGGDLTSVESIYGGYAANTSGSCTANNNTVEISDVTVKSGVSGGLADSLSGETSNNRVTLTNTIIQSGAIYGGRAHSLDTSGPPVFGYGTATNNTVSLTGGSVGGSVFGGHTEAGTASNNTVTINGGHVAYGVSGGNAGNNSSANTTPSEAMNNTVVITDGDIGGGISGGHAGGYNGNATASGNSVIITGGTLAGNVSGARVYAQNSGVATATNNTVTLSGAIAFAASSALYGGEIILGTDPGNDAFTGNTLNLREYTGNAVRRVENFQYFNFLLPASLQPFTTDDLVLGNGSLGSTITGVGIVSGGTAPQVGDTLTLIKASSSLTGTLDNDGATISGQKGVSLLYDFQLSQTANALTATVLGVRANPKTKALSEGHAASMAFIRQGHDLIVDTGFAAADAYLGRTGAGWSSPVAFGAFGGGHSRHKTGSHVDVDGVSLMAGLAWRNNVPCGSLLLGAFFEAGYADYDTHNAFSSGAVRGDGDSRYFGGGVLARYDWQSGLYAEVSGRVGGVKNKFHSELTDAFGNRARYEINSPYFGAHAGIGYKWQLNENALLDVSTKYLWSRQNGDTANVLGDRVHFEDEDSHRVRTGARFSYAVNGCVSPYVGAAFEYEFDGKAYAGAYGASYGVPSLKGGTGIGEIGVTMRRNAFSADLGVQGHVGRREGVTGSLRVGWSF